MAANPVHRLTVEEFRHIAMRESQAVKRRAGLACLLPLPAVLLAQDKGTESPPLPMPTDRAEDSYAIYSSLLPLGETANPGWPHELFLVREATIAVVAADRPCRPEPQRDSSSSFDISINPHLALHPPPANNRDIKEILQDFDTHCHERLKLSAAGWKTSAPVRLLTPAEQKEFQATRTGGTDAESKFKCVSALYGFSRVYFNTSRTVAIVYATHWCGGLCGQGFWVAFGLRDGKWKPLGWQSDSWIS